MNRRRINLYLAAFFFFLAFLSFPIAPRAEVAGIFGVEHYRWTELFPPRQLVETGPRIVLGIRQLQDKPKGILFGYQGIFRTGTADYNGWAQDNKTKSFSPLTTKSDYFGLDNNFSTRYRFFNEVSGSYYFDIIGSLGLDYWVRNINSTTGTSGYAEYYLISYAKAGLGAGKPESGPRVEAGIKYPVWTNETAGTAAVGQSSSNPVLSPGKNISYFASATYKFKSPWSVNVSYEGFRFPPSELVNSDSPDYSSGSLKWILTKVQQPESWQDIYIFTVGYAFD
jgi:hypothetical protein